MTDTKRPHLTLLALLAIALPAITPPSHAQQTPSDEEIRPRDTIIFRNTAGFEETMVGDIISEKFDSVEFRQSAGGTVTLPRANIVTIIARRTPEEVYKTKRSRVPDVGADPATRARANLALGLWCRTPHPRLRGEPPAPDRAWGHLLKAVQLDPGLHDAYPHLLDLLAGRRESAADPNDIVLINDEVAIYTLAAQGGFRHPEIDFRMGELYLRMDLKNNAASRFEAVISSPEPMNHSLVRRARHYLSRIYLSRDEARRALELYDPESVTAAATGSGAVDAAAVDAAFERVYLGARVLLNRGDPEDRARAREYLEKAAELQPDYAGVALQLAAIGFLEGELQRAHDRLMRTITIAPDDPALHSAFGLVLLERGRFDRAESELRTALDRITALRGTRWWEASYSRVESQSRIGLGLIHEHRGRLADAVIEYELALRAVPGSAVAALHLAGALAATGREDDAAKLLESSVRDRSDDAALFAANARALADIALRRGDEEEALLLLGYAVDLQESDPALNRKLAHVLLRKDRLEAARTHLEAASTVDPENPELLCALGYLHYTRGDMQTAEEAFRKVIKLVPRPKRKSDGTGPPVPGARLYAEQGLARILDTYNLEVWHDRFAREDADEIQRGWLKHENFGVRISIRDGAIVFSGTQTNDADGVTKLYRDVDVGDVERLSVRIRVPEGSRVRAGLRMETTEDTGIGLVLFRDFDGVVRFATKTTRSDWEDAKPTGETDPSRGRLIFAGGVPWPDDGQYHTLEVRQDDDRRGRYDLLLDDTIVAQNVSIGSFGRRTKVIQVGVSGQVERLGETCEFSADDFRIFRKRARAVRPGQR